MSKQDRRRVIEDAERLNIANAVLDLPIHYSRIRKYKRCLENH